MAFGDIVLLKDRTARGPYTRAQIQEGLGCGDFSPRDLAHTPGLRDWLPLLEVLHHLDREPVHAPRPPMRNASCRRCRLSQAETRPRRRTSIPCERIFPRQQILRAGHRVISPRCQ